MCVYFSLMHNSKLFMENSQISLWSISKIRQFGKLKYLCAMLLCVIGCHLQISQSRSTIYCPWH